MAKSTQNSDEVGTTDEATIVQIVKPPSRIFRVVKRSFAAILIPFVLLIIAILMLTIFGVESINKAENFIDKIWLPATLVRLIVYCLIALWVVPFFINKAKQRNDYETDMLNNDLSSGNYPEEELEGIIKFIQRAESQDKIYSYLLNNKKIIFIFLLIFEIITLQSPYFLGR